MNILWRIKSINDIREYLMEGGNPETPALVQECHVKWDLDGL
jgi:hypothetical protein